MSSTRRKTYDTLFYFVMPCFQFRLRPPIKFRQIKPILRVKQTCVRKSHVISTLHDHNYFVVLEENRTHSLLMIFKAFKIIMSKKANKPDFYFKLCGFLPTFRNYRIFYTRTVYFASPFEVILSGSKQKIVSYVFSSVTYEV
jgi:hypothetical protein